MIPALVGLLAGRGRGAADRDRRRLPARRRASRAGQRRHRGPRPHRAARGRRYNVCYVNGFQTQPSEKAFWRKHRGLVLRDADGRPVVDEAWGECLLDLRTPDKRQRARPDRGPLGAGLRGGRLRRRRVRQPRLLHPQRRAADPARRRCGYAALLVDARARARAGGRPEEPGRLRRHHGSATTSRSPRSAAATTSAALRRRLRRPGADDRVPHRGLRRDLRRRTARRTPSCCATAT